MKYKEHNGFTIVELLVVIVVIAILAAIITVAYNGITQRTVEASIKTDIRNIATGAELTKSTSGDYPTLISGVSNGQGYTTSDGNAATYEKKPYGYCISIVNSRTNAPLVLRSSSGQVTEGSCTSTVSTLAGSGAAGFNDATGTAAQFNEPHDIDADGAGNVYVADRSNFRIRKVSQTGAVTTFAGTGSDGFTDGPAASARFSHPWGVAVSTTGSVYVADANTQRIRVISTSNVVSTLAGTGSLGFVDGAGSAALFRYPSGVALDTAGNVYVSDTNNHAIRKVTPAGVVTTLAGSGVAGFADGQGAAAQFSSPDGVAVDSAGNVYVADTSNHRIRKITPSGSVSTLAGTGTAGSINGAGATARFDSPRDVTIDNAGTLYIADNWTNSIRSVKQDGTVSTLAGSGVGGYADGPATTARFNRPIGVAVDGAFNVYVVDMDNRVRKITQ